MDRFFAGKALFLSGLVAQNGLERHNPARQDDEQECKPAIHCMQPKLLFVYLSYIKIKQSCYIYQTHQTRHTPKRPQRRARNESQTLVNKRVMVGKDVTHTSKLNRFIMLTLFGRFVQNKQVSSRLCDASYYDQSCEHETKEQLERLCGSFWYASPSKRSLFCISLLCIMGHGDFDKMDLDSSGFSDDEVYNALHAAATYPNEKNIDKAIEKARVQARSRRARLEGCGFKKCQAHGVAHIYQQEPPLLVGQPGQAQQRVQPRSLSRNPDHIESLARTRRDPSFEQHTHALDCLRHEGLP